MDFFATKSQPRDGRHQNLSSVNEPHFKLDSVYIIAVSMALLDSNHTRNSFRKRTLCADVDCQSSECMHISLLAICRAQLRRGAPFIQNKICNTLLVGVIILS